MSATNGNGKINGKRSVNGAIAQESFGFMGAECVSMATSLGVMAIADQLIPAPILKTASRAVGNICILPFLETIEKGLGKVCKLDECKADTTKPREERAEALARTIMIFGTAWVLSMEAKLRTRRFINNKIGFVEHLPPSVPKGAPFTEHLKLWKRWSPEERMILAADEGVHYGSMILMNTVAAPQTDDMIRTTTKILKDSFGFSDKKAHELSTTVWVWEAPNFLGMASAMLAIAGRHKFGWPYQHKARTHVEQLEHQTSLSSSHPTPQV